MDSLPEELRDEWMCAIGHEGSSLVEEAALNICRQLGLELREMKTDTKNQQNRLEVFVKCIQTMLFTYGERLVTASGGDTSLAREQSRDFYAAVLSVHLDILALQKHVSLDTTANLFASQMNRYLKDSVLQMMDVFLQSEQVSLSVDQDGLIAPSVRLMASIFPKEPSLWEYARAVVLVHRLKLKSEHSADFRHALQRAKTPEDAERFFSNILGAISLTNNNEGELTRHLLAVNISADDCERIIEALTSATESSADSDGAEQIEDTNTMNESPDEDEMIIDRQPVEAFDDNHVVINPVVDVQQGKTALIESSTPGFNSPSKKQTRQSKRKFASPSSETNERNSRSSGRSSAVASSPIGCVADLEEDQSVRSAQKEQRSPVRRSRRISKHLPAAEDENGTDVVVPATEPIVMKEMDEPMEEDESKSASEGSSDDDKEGEESGRRAARTAPERRVTPRLVRTEGRVRASAPTAINGDPTPPLKLRLRQKTNAPSTVDRSKTPTVTSAASKRAQTAKASKAATVVGASTTEPRATRRSAKTPQR